MVSLLEVKNVTKRFGGILALDCLSLNVARNTILGVIGPNGSGKTTFVNLATGFCEVDQGNLLFNGDIISGLRPHNISKLGIARTFQEAKVFKKMTLLENLLVASPCGIGKQAMQEAENLLEFVELLDLEDEYAGNLSYGQQKLLEFARVLMLDPQLIFLDEPTAGINPVLIDKMLQCFRILHDRGKTLVVVEHNIPVVGAICEKAIVLDHGKKIAEGTPDEIQRNKAVHDAYLGSG